MRLICVFIIPLILLSCSKQQDKILPEQKSLTESVYDSVTIRPDSLYQVHAIISGILDSNLVEEGDIISEAVLRLGFVGKCFSL